MMRQKRPIFLLFMTLCCVLGMLGCSQGVFDCTYTIRVSNQEVKDSTETLMTSGVVYLFYADTMHYRVGDWASASRGVVINRSTSAELKPFASVSLADSNPAVFTGLNQEKLILLICDTLTKTYAWKAAEVYEELELVTVPVHFRSWKTEFPYQESNWNFNK